MVIGPCGAGKSTAATRVAALLDLPLFHLDRFHWHPGWVEGDKAELRAALEPVVSQEKWIIDGNYGSTMKRRLERADTILYLDYSTLLCLFRAVKRVWRYRGRTRPDMTEGCPERFDYEFFRYIFNWNIAPRQRTEALLDGCAVDIHRFGTPRQLEHWIGNLENSQ
ncbi:topology modulation protein [Altererythrobacter sp.]|nr:topology modulation protein [Altererythrobacter sp.]